MYLFLQLHGLKSSRNSSHPINHRCEWTIIQVQNTELTLIGTQYSVLTSVNTSYGNLDHRLHQHLIYLVVASSKQFLPVKEL